MERDYPGPGPYVCPAPSAYPPPTPEGQAQAGQLASDAVQAVILGELPRAQELLMRASELDPTSAELAYRHARVLEDLASHDEAIDEYCRALDLGAEDAGIADARARLDATYDIVRERIPPAALEAFVTGLQAADLGLLEAAVGSFTIAIMDSPDWAAALYNRAVVLEALGRVTESLADYRDFLLLNPTDVDPAVMRASERIGLLEGMVTAPTPSPAGALALGMAFPGMGQYYSGRGLTGTVVLSMAAGAVAAGILVKEVTVRCLNPGSSGDCAPADVIEESTRRPYLWPALGAAAAVTLVGAAEAFIRARGRRAQAEATEAAAETASRPTDGVRLSGPTLVARGARVEISMLSLRFR